MGRKRQFNPWLPEFCGLVVGTNAEAGGATCVVCRPADGERWVGFFNDPVRLARAIDREPPVSSPCDFFWYPHPLCTSLLARDLNHFRQLIAPNPSQVAVITFLVIRVRANPADGIAANGHEMELAWRVASRVWGRFREQSVFPIVAKDFASYTLLISIRPVRDIEAGVARAERITSILNARYSTADVVVTGVPLQEPLPAYCGFPSRPTLIPLELDSLTRRERGRIADRHDLWDLLAEELNPEIEAATQTEGQALTTQPVGTPFAMEYSAIIQPIATDNPVGFHVSLSQSWAVQCGEQSGQAECLLAVFRHEKDGRWRMCLGNSGDIFVENRVGFHHIRELLSRPGTPVEASELIRSQIERDQPEGIQTKRFYRDVSATLDSEAIQVYRSECSRLRNEIEVAQGSENAGAAADLEAQLDAIRSELRRAGVREDADTWDHLAGSIDLTSKRQRERILNAIRRALDQIRDGPLRQHLVAALRLDEEFAYRPTIAVSWSL